MTAEIMKLLCLKSKKLVMLLMHSENIFIFWNPNISVDAEWALYEGLILSILLYSAECYNFKTSNKELLRRLNLRKIDDYIIKRQLRWGGHVARIDFDGLPEKCLSGYVLNVPLVHLNLHTALFCISCWQKLVLM